MTNSSWRSFDCFVIKQSDSGPEVALLAFDAYILRELATVSRIADEDYGYQRIINNRRLAAIKRYVETPGAVLPTGIVLASGEKPGYVTVEHRKPVAGQARIWSAKLKIKVTKTYKPFLVIDGQHRLFGITASRVAPYPVPVTILLDAPKLVQMANFQIINNKATRIPSAHLNELRGLMFDLTSHDADELNKLLGQLGAASLASASLVSELNGTGMVFEGILNFPSNREQGFVSSQTLVTNVERSRLGGFLSYYNEENDDHLTAYNSLWLGVRKKFKKRWDYEVGLFSQDSPKRSKARKSQSLLHSATISVLGQILDKELSATTYRPRWMDDPHQVCELVQKEILGPLSARMWDDIDIKIDNTSKGKRALKSHIDAMMIAHARSTTS